MVVSINGGTPTSSILVGCSINHPFGGTPIYGNPHMGMIWMMLNGSESKSVFFLIVGDGAVKSASFSDCPWTLISTQWCPSSLGHLVNISKLGPMTKWLTQSSWFGHGPNLEQHQLVPSIELARLLQKIDVNIVNITIKYDKTYPTVVKRGNWNIWIFSTQEWCFK